MPLEDSIIPKRDKGQEDFEREFGKILEQINIDRNADNILTNEDKFSLIIRKTKNLITFAGNKFIYYVATSNNNKLSYITIDDYSQDAKMMLWNIIESNPDKPLVEILKIFKTALWRITICYFRKSRLKKNFGSGIIYNNREHDGDTIDTGDSLDNMAYHHGTKRVADNYVYDLDKDEIKEKFSEYVVNNLDVEDAQIFNLIAHPQNDFLQYCYSCCYSKKKKHKDIISQSNIASYLKVPISYVHNRIKKITKAFSEFKEVYIDR